MNDNDLLHQINGIILTYISGIVDELWHEVHAECEKEDIEHMFHDILGIVEGNLDRATDNIYSDLEDYLKFEGKIK